MFELLRFFFSIMNLLQLIENDNIIVQHFRATLYQLHKRKTSTILQPPHVRP